MKSESFTNEDIKNLVIRPIILKRDNYSCQCCGVKHKSRVYINSRKNYVTCDEFIEQWAKKEGKSVFTVFLNIINIKNFSFSENPEDYLTLCPKHSQMYNRDVLKDFRNSFKAKTEQMQKIIDHDFFFYKTTILDEFIKDVKEITSHRITTIEADSIITNLLNNTKNR